MLPISFKLFSTAFRLAFQLSLTLLEYAIGLELYLGLEVVDSRIRTAISGRTNLGLGTSLHASPTRLSRSMTELSSSLRLAREI